MRLLLDTHIYIWAVTADARLSDDARNTIVNADEVWVSSACIWEAAIKSGLGKLQVNMTDLISEITLSGFVELPVRAIHAAGVRDLPPLHRDPFDRLLVAQAMHEQLFLLTSDKILASYGDFIKIV